MLGVRTAQKNVPIQPGLVDSRGVVIPVGKQNEAPVAIANENPMVQRFII